MWRAVRWPVLLLAITAVLLGVATILDQTSAREYALVIGAPALTILLPVGIIWLVVALLFHLRRVTREPG